MVIYKTTNLVNNKIYIGKDSKNDKNYFGSGKILTSAIKKYGKNNFKKEILETCKTLEELDLREKVWINFCNSNNRKIGYNISEGGTGGDNYKNKTKKELKESKKKISLGVLKSIKNGKKCVGFNSETAKQAALISHNKRTKKEYKKIANKGLKTKKQKGTHPSSETMRLKNSNAVKEFWQNNPQVKIEASLKNSLKQKGKTKLELFQNRYGEKLGLKKYTDYITKMSNSKKGKSPWNKGIKLQKYEIKK